MFHTSVHIMHFWQSVKLFFLIIAKKKFEKLFMYITTWIKYTFFVGHNQQVILFKPYSTWLFIMEAKFII